MPVMSEVFIGVAETVDLLVAHLRGAALDAHGVGVPLGVLVAGVSVLCGHITAVQDVGPGGHRVQTPVHEDPELGVAIDRKSTRLNSSHVAISYAVFFLKKKNNSTIY